MGRKFVLEGRAVEKGKEKWRSKQQEEVVLVVAAVRIVEPVVDTTGKASSVVVAAFDGPLCEGNYGGGASRCSLGLVFLYAKVRGTISCH